MKNSKTYDIFSKKNQLLVKMLNYILNLFFCTQKCNGQSFDLSSKNIIVLCNSLIGDTIIYIPFFRMLRYTYRSARIVFVGSQISGEILEREGLVDETKKIEWASDLSTFLAFLSHKNKIKSLLMEKKIVYDIAIEVRGDFRVIYFLRYIHAKRKVSPGVSGGEALLTDVCAYTPNTPSIERAITLGKYLDCILQASDALPQLRKYKNEVLEAEFETKYKLSSYEKIIGINPGASQEKKKWKGFPALIDILDNEKLLLVFYYTNDDIKMIEEMCKHSEKKGIPYIKVQKNFTSYVESLNISRLIIANDSSAGHISAALGIPTISIFGPTDWRLWAPKGNCMIKIVYEKIPCAPCNKLKCDRNNECLTSIKPEYVKLAIDSILAMHPYEKLF